MMSQRGEETKKEKGREENVEQCNEGPTLQPGTDGMLRHYFLHFFSLSFIFFFSAKVKVRRICRKADTKYVRVENC